MSWKKEVKHRFSTKQDASKWHDMYNENTQNLDDAIFRQRRDWTIDYIKRNFSKDASICDIGCGAGPITYELLRLDFKPIALDYSDDMLRNAKERISTLVRQDFPLINGNSESLPFPDNSFDCAVCLGVISYVEHYENIIKEIERVLKPGGTAIITYRNCNNLIMNDPIVIGKELFKLVTGKNKDNPEPPFVIGRYMNYKEVLSTAEKSGLSFNHFMGMGYGPYQFNYKNLYNERTSIALDKFQSKLLNLFRAKPLVKLAADVHILVFKKY